MVDIVCAAVLFEVIRNYGTTVQQFADCLQLKSSIVLTSRAITLIININIPPNQIMQ